ncbi:peptidylprolyl isomerase, partial [Paraburkholderia sp. BR10937]|uniref:peptidylprolyl isomerase n=1 Tax=Paraburkholderia sp. BR10937 TaxID=3236994 RepID=UPI0034D175D7
VELYPEKAPKTVDNFLQYVKAGQYNGTIFHRVIRGFMTQGGGFDAGMKQKPTEAPIENEANNGLKNERGSIAMARTN